MSETFELAAPRINEFVLLRSKLGELFFDGNSAPALVDLLTVPVPFQKRTSGGDLTPPQASYHGSGNSSKRKSISLSAQGSSRPQKRTKHDQANNTGNKANARSPATICTLPVEIILLIIFHIEYIDDVRALGLVNRYLFHVSQEELAKYFAQMFGRWAGKEIVCVGEDTEPDDYPPGLFSETEIDRLRGMSVNVDDGSGDPDNIVLSLALFATPYISRERKRLDLTGETIYTMSVLDGLPRSERFGKDCMMRALTEHGHVQNFVPNNQSWILRNKTTKQFVRSEPIALKPEFIHGPHIDVMGFGDAILARIC